MRIPVLNRIQTKFHWGILDILYVNPTCCCGCWWTHTAPGPNRWPWRPSIARRAAGHYRDPEAGPSWWTTGRCSEDSGSLPPVRVQAAAHARRNRTSAWGTPASGSPPSWSRHRYTHHLSAVWARSTAQGRRDTPSIVNIRPRPGACLGRTERRICER